jgi:hypothetical protein
MAVTAAVRDIVATPGALSSTGLARIAVQGATSSSLATKKFFSVVLTTGPEEILCSGRGGSRAPIRGPLPLLGSATGSQGSLRRMCHENIPVWIGKRLT